MLPTSSITPERVFVSAWQALGNLAATRTAAAVVQGLLTGPRAFKSSPLPSCALPSPADVRRGEADRAWPGAVDAGSFHRWTVLTDAYAQQFLRMQRGDPAARCEALRLSREMVRMNEELACLA